MAKRFLELTTTERKAICNGCGGKGGLIKPPQFIFQKSCDHHDYNYFLGYTEEHRKKADKQFHEAMKEQNINIYEARKSYLNWLQRILAYKDFKLLMAMAWTYYKAVRLLGKKYFHYGDKEQEF